MATAGSWLNSVELRCGIVNHCANGDHKRRKLWFSSHIMNMRDSFPDDVEALKRLLLARDAELAQARADKSSAEALITHLRLTIEKLKREIYGPRNERKARLIDQMELELEELEAAAAEDKLIAEKAPRTTRRWFAPSRATSLPASRSPPTCHGNA